MKIYSVTVHSETKPSIKHTDLTSVYLPTTFKPIKNIYYRILTVEMR